MIHVIATAMSGSVQDQMKVKKIKPEFSKYFSEVVLHAVDSHNEAYSKAKNLVAEGNKILIAAGGAGTINSVVRGCYESGNISDDLRIGVIRKGSADLIGKVLNISDDLNLAIKSIVNAIEKDNYIHIDLVGVSDVDNFKYIDYFVGFGGIGVFGNIPYFTENRFKKYYKGILGFLFGDRGPFFVGAVLSSITFYVSKVFKRDKSKITITIDDGKEVVGRWNSVIILNGDLGKHFPIAPGMPLDDGMFRVVLLRDRGLLKLFSQFIGCWTGKILVDKKLGRDIYDVKKIKISPSSDDSYLVNVDGLLNEVHSSIEFKVVYKLKMYHGN